MMATYLIQNCRLENGKTITATEALRMRNATSRRTVRGAFFCHVCGGDLVVHDTKPPHFEHARSTDGRPQPDCSFRFDTPAHAINVPD